MNTAKKLLAFLGIYKSCSTCGTRPVSPVYCKFGDVTIEAKQVRIEATTDGNISPWSTTIKLFNFSQPTQYFVRKNLKLGKMTSTLPL